MRPLTVAAVLLCSNALAGDKVMLPRLDPVVLTTLESYLVQHYQAPEDYVLSKFRDHDVVFLGESHRIKADVELVQHLIPRLYRAGVFTLCTEYARREDQPLIDRLLSAPEYDETLAREVTWRSAWFWGFKEYLDIYRVAWDLNHSLARGARPFRILALNDSPDWSVLKRAEDWNSSVLRRRVWGRNSGEDQSAKVILERVVARHEKALVYCGRHHAFTEYRQPIFDEKAQRLLRLADDRAGNYVFHAIGKRAITICLHGPWFPATGYSGREVYPVGGAIDALIHQLPPRYRSAGFDTRGTPFGSLGSSDSIYKWGHEPFSLDKYCDGYIIQGPLSEIVGVTPIRDFINAGNIEYVRRRLLRPESRGLSIAELNAGIASDAQVVVRLCEHLQ